jgi:hypothetical protein
VNTMIKRSSCQVSPSQTSHSQTFRVLLAWSKAAHLRAAMAAVDLTAVGIEVNNPTKVDPLQIKRAHCSALDSAGFVMSMKKMSPILIKYQNPLQNMRLIEDQMAVALTNALSVKSFMARFDSMDNQLNVCDSLDQLRIRQIAQRCYICLIKAYNFKLSRISV